MHVNENNYPYRYLYTHMNMYINSKLSVAGVGAERGMQWDRIKVGVFVDVGAFVKVLREWVWHRIWGCKCVCLC